MNLISVQSRSLQAVGYDELRRALFIRFITGKLYRYSGVPRTAFDALLAAPSKGTFFNEEIRGRYSYEKL
jgi:hypothetical protein